MYVAKDLPRGALPPKEEPFEAYARPLSLGDPLPKSHLLERGADRSSSTPSPQELTLSYMCENLGFSDRDAAADRGAFPGSAEKLASKGKEVVSEAPVEEDRKWVVRDFLQFAAGGSSDKGKRPIFEVEDCSLDGEYHGKRVKVEALGLSLAPPSLSLSLNMTNPVPKSATAPGSGATDIPTDVDLIVKQKSNTFNSLNSAHLTSKPAPAPAPASSGAADPPLVAALKRSQSNNTFNTHASSDDFSHSCSLQFSAFSHNPSCSLTHNSTEYEYSRDTDHFWNAGGGEGTNGSVHSRFKPIGGEGTNGSVHSRFKPIGDTNSVSFANQNGYPRFPLSSNKEITSGHFRPCNSGDNSFFPSKIPARARKDHSKAPSNSGRNVTLAKPEQILGEVLSESVPSVAQIFEDLPSDSIDATKEYLRSLMSEPAKKEEFYTLQRRLERRSDLTSETLIKSNKIQLDILVSIKTGLVNFLSGKNHLPTKELVEIFLLSRCKNVNCKSILPIDDCDCSICSSKKGFCSACMCPVCMNFDCAENTCSWVGCDVCSHWCHAMCGIQKNLIRPGPSLKGTAGTTEMQFHCLGCGHASEMFGFVKDVFVCCAKDWGIETLKKELNCVRKIFRGNDDPKGKMLHRKAVEMLTMLEENHISCTDASIKFLQFLQSDVSSFSIPVSSSVDAIAPPPDAIILKPDAVNVISTLSGTRGDLLRETKSIDLRIPDHIPIFGLTRTDEAVKTDGFESLESMVRCKQAEAALFQRLADEARREVEAYMQIARVKSEKLEEEYTGKLAKLCLQETEERQRKKLDELKVLENAQCDYHKMKMRMEAEMAGLLERMEATKQQWA